MRKILRNVLGPTSFTGVATAATKLVDLALGATYGGESQVSICNNSGTPLYWCYSIPTTGTPTGTPNGLTTNTGLTLPAGATIILDDIGGLQVWAIAGSGTFDVRVTGGYA